MTRRERRTTFRSAAFVRVLLVMLGAVVLVGVHCAAAELTEKEVKKLGTFPRFGGSDYALSPDGARLALVATRDAGEVVVCDGEDGPACDQVCGLTFSGNGRVLAYAACKDNQWHVVVGRKAGPGHSSVQGPSLSHNGGVVAYYAPSDEGDGKVYVNGEPRKSHRALSVVTPVVSSSGRVAFAGRATGTFEMANPLAADGGTRTGNWGYTDMLQRRIYIACDRSRGRLFNTVRAPVFSPNSQSYAYAALAEGKWFMICNRDKVGGPFNDVSDPVWSPNSRKLAYAASEGAQWFVVSGSGREGPLEGVGVIAFSPGAGHLAYAARNAGQWVLVCDGKKGPAYDEIQWIGFPASERHLACAVEQGGQSRMVIDGVQGPGHERIIVPQLAATDKNTLRYVAVDGGEATLVEVAWPNDTDWKTGFE